MSRISKIIFKHQSHIPDLTSLSPTSDATRHSLLVSISLCEVSMDQFNKKCHTICRSSPILASIHHSIICFPLLLAHHVFPCFTPLLYFYFICKLFSDYLTWCYLKFWLALGSDLSFAHCSIWCSFFVQQANLAFAAIKNREVIGKVLITFDDPKAARAKL